jgi:hypothetical protein
MDGKLFGPRKRRTRQHVIADQGMHHVLGHVLEAGFTADALLRDYGYDLQMTTYDEGTLNLALFTSKSNHLRPSNEQNAILFLISIFATTIFGFASSHR